MDSVSKAAETNIFDRRLWLGFLRITRLYWASEEKWRAWSVLGLLLAFLLAFTGLNVMLNFVGRDFMTALSEKNVDDFQRTLLIYLGAFVVATPVSALFSYVQKLLGVNWREWLTRHYLDRYLADRAYYRINDDPAIDNPDQRIAQDIASFTVTSLAFLSIIFFAAVQLVSFVGILWGISRLLVGVLVAYAVVGTAVTLFFGRRLIHLNFQQLRKEADFRYGLVHIRNNAESIAFYRGEAREGAQIGLRLADVIGNFRMLIGWERNLEFFTRGYEYVILVLPIVVMAPLYFDGEIKFGVLTQAEGAFTTVLGALSIIVAQFEKLSTFAAGVTRLETFADALDGDGAAGAGTPADKQDSPAGSPAGSEGDVGATAAGAAGPAVAVTAGALAGIASIEAPRLALERVTVLTPNRAQTLIRDATAEVPRGGGLLIVGPSGAGKSSVLRAVAGLWTTGAGLIERPPLAEVIFLPQRPYMVLGSLRDQLRYPRSDLAASDDEFRQVLDTVNLPELLARVGGLDATLDWGTLLSLGEQQRLAFARLVLTRPAYAVLDEATSALDVANEGRLYARLKESGATYVSVGHRPTLFAYHDLVLELQGKGAWRLVTAAEYRASAAGAGA